MKTHESFVVVSRLRSLRKICFAVLAIPCIGCGAYRGAVAPYDSGTQVEESSRPIPMKVVAGADRGQIFDGSQQSAPGVRTLPSPRLVMTPEVDRQIQRFAISERGYIESALPNYEKYYDKIAAIFREHGVPENLINLAIVESRFRPHAESHKGAVGLWQLMSRTARSFGLRTHGRDERKDPIRSSVAAAQYLRQLYEILGDWYLALAAYNGGIGRLTRAMVDTGIFDFWQLARSGKLARETADFVPRFIAITLIMNDPEKYGFSVAFDPSSEESRLG
jgi:Transglycosylase SLT domain